MYTYIVVYPDLDYLLVKLRYSKVTQCDVCDSVQHTLFFFFKYYTASGVRTATDITSVFIRSPFTRYRNSTGFQVGFLI